MNWALVIIYLAACLTLALFLTKLVEGSGRRLQSKDFR